MTDRAFEELQRRCKRLKNKRFLKWFLALVLFAIVVMFVIFNFYIDKPVKKELPIKKVVKPAKPKRVLLKIKKTTQKPIKKKITKKDKYNTIVLNSTIVIPKVTIHQPKTKKLVVKKEIKKVAVMQKEQKQVVDIKVTLLKDEQSLIKDNQEHENFNSTLSLAKYYYKHSKYEKAIYFAKKANRYKPSSFKPWEYYAKSKTKQNKQPEAIEAIKQYLSYFDSDEAMKLLQEIGGKK